MVFLTKTLAKQGGAALGAALLVAPLGCLEPTEAIVDISTDANCAHVESTGINAGLIGALETAPYGTTTSQCSGDGVIGSIVLLPPEDDKQAPFAFRVVTSLDAPLESCIPPSYGPSCIVVRRAMRFVPAHAFHVPVHMGQACAGVRCPEEQTCSGGTCVSLTIDPSDCDDPAGCGAGPGAVPAWEKTFGGSGVQMARHIALAQDGTIALGGNFEGSVNLGEGLLPSKGGQDLFLATFSQAGILRWSRSFGGVGRDDGAFVAIDGRGDIYLLASFENTIDFGGGKLVSAGATDVALAKFTTSGKLEWALRMGSALTDGPGNVAVGPDGNIYVTGEFSDKMPMGDVTLTSAGGYDGFFASFTPSGDVRWAKALGGAGSDAATGVGVDGGHVYVSGHFYGSMKLDSLPPLESVGNSDVFLARFDVDGNLGWVKSFGSGATDLPRSLAARGDRVVVTGVIASKATIDGTVLDAGDSAGFVTAFDPTGKLVWGTAFGHPKEMDSGESVAIAEDGSIVLGGTIVQGSVFDSAPMKKDGLRSPFVAVLERDGAPRWTKTFPSSYFASVPSVAAPTDGFALVAGWFSEKLDVGPEVFTSKEAEDMFFLRVSPP